mmetsp:Transcript_13768/g.39878  ORF Transcript_13768/g.39878 Transcript_13768/m.39878 type:complete len:225 (-) Transcript_13768:3349-4023(-)
MRRPAGGVGGNVMHDVLRRGGRQIGFGAVGCELNKWHPLHRLLGLRARPSAPRVRSILPGRQYYVRTPCCLSYFVDHAAAHAGAPMYTDVRAASAVGASVSLTLLCPEEEGATSGIHSSDRGRAPAASSRPHFFTTCIAKPAPPHALLLTRHRLALESPTQSDGSGPTHHRRTLRPPLSPCVSWRAPLPTALSLLSHAPSPTCPRKHAASHALALRRPRQHHHR